LTPADNRVYYLHMTQTHEQMPGDFPDFMTLLEWQQLHQEDLAGIASLLQHFYANGAEDKTMQSVCSDFLECASDLFDNIQALMDTCHSFGWVRKI